MTKQLTEKELWEHCISLSGGDAEVAKIFYLTLQMVNISEDSVYVNFSLYYDSLGKKIDLENLEFAVRGAVRYFEYHGKEKITFIINDCPDVLLEYIDWFIKLMGFQESKQVAFFTFYSKEAELVFTNKKFLSKHYKFGKEMYNVGHDIEVIFE